MAHSWSQTALWRETCGIPQALEATLADRAGQEAVAATLRGARRVVATGNGAAYYAAVALWLSSLEGAAGPEVQAVPAGLVARGAFRWREGDRLLAFSSSGEMRDVIEALDTGAPRPFAAITATPTSTIGSRADAVAHVAVASQDAVTHTQAFCGNVVAALAVWALVTGDALLEATVQAAPDALLRAARQASAWVEDVAPGRPDGAVVFGSGPAWAGALEGALLLKEVALVPAEGVETREGATSAMYALTERHLAVSLPAAEDPLLTEAEGVCAGRGATIVRAPGGELADRRLSPVTTFPALVALAATLAVERGHDPDRPTWTDAYLSVARGTP